MFSRKQMDLHFRRVWVGGWVAIVVLGLVSLWDISIETCNSHVPILLSRALTSEPYRGLLLSFCVLAVVSSFFLKSILLIGGFLGFLCAFLVSMFTTPTTHDALIVMSSILIMLECFPTYGSRTWKLHWAFTLVSGLVCTTWMIYSKVECETLYCERCSWWYISEYLFFWSLYLLVYWRIPVTLKWKDRVDWPNHDCDQCEHKRNQAQSQHSLSEPIRMHNSNINIVY